jgi:hypothetical protein
MVIKLKCWKRDKNPNLLPSWIVWNRNDKKEKVIVRKAHGFKGYVFQVTEQDKNDKNTYTSVSTNPYKKKSVAKDYAEIYMNNNDEC